MNNTLTLIKLQLKSSIRLDSAKSRLLTIAKWAISAFAILVLLFIFVVVYVLITNNISNDFSVTMPGTESTSIRVTLQSEFFTFTFLGFHVLQILFLIPILLKHLKIGEEREILLRLPITSRQILLSKIITIYILELIFTAIVLLPILIAFGLVIGASGFYYGMIPLILILAPIIPFFVANILVVPINMLIDFIKVHRNIMILAYLLIGFGLVFLYMQVITQASWLVLNKGLKADLQKNYWTITKTASRFFLQKLFASAVVNANLTSVAWIFLSSALIGAMAIMVAIYIYRYYYNHDVVNVRHIKIKDRTNPKNPIRAYLVKELKNITRSSNYTFQFLVFIVIMPLLVYFCARLAGIASVETFRGYENNPNINVNQNTKDIILGITILVFLIIIPLANSFAAISISREGGNIYQCKILPIGFRQQVMIKMLLCYVPILFSTLISVIVLRIPQTFGQYFFTLPTTTFLDTIVLFLIVSTISLGLVCLGIYLDLSKPVCKSVGNGEMTKTNKASAIVLVLGLLIAIVMGVTTMLNIILHISNLTLIFALFSVVFGVGLFLLLYFRCQTLFDKVEGA